MKSPLWGVAILLSAGLFSAGAEESRRDVAFYAMDKLPSVLKFEVPPEVPAVFRLEENVTTGYQWSARYDPEQAQVRLVSRGASGMRCGAPGEVRVEIILRQKVASVVTLSYRRPFEPEKTPALTLTVTVVPTGIPEK